MKELLFYFTLFLFILFLLAPDAIQTETVQHVKATWNLLVHHKVIP